MPTRKPAPSPEHLRFAVLAADTALFTLKDSGLYVRTVAVNRPPYFTNAWGLPGGLLAPDETAEAAALRHLSEKAGVDLKKIYAEQLYTFSEVDRDPRGRVVAVAYLALVPWELLSPAEQADTDSAKWLSVKQAKGLAYDHDEILRMATARLASRATYTTLISKLMPTEFTLTELEKGYAAILKTALDKRNFRKKILKLKVLKALGKKRSLGRARPAALYRFSSSKVEEIDVI